MPMTITILRAMLPPSKLSSVLGNEEMVEFPLFMLLVVERIGNGGNNAPAVCSASGWAPMSGGLDDDDDDPDVESVR